MSDSQLLQTYKFCIECGTELHSAQCTMCGWQIPGTNAWVVADGKTVRLNSSHQKPSLNSLGTISASGIIWGDDLSWIMNTDTIYGSGIVVFDGKVRPVIYMSGIRA